MVTLGGGAPFGIPERDGALCQANGPSGRVRCRCRFRCGSRSPPPARDARVPRPGQASAWPCSHRLARTGLASSTGRVARHSVSRARVKAESGDLHVADGEVPGAAGGGQVERDGEEPGRHRVAAVPRGRVRMARTRHLDHADHPHERVGTERTIRSASGLRYIDQVAIRLKNLSRPARSGPAPSPTRSTSLTPFNSRSAAVLVVSSCTVGCRARRAVTRLAYPRRSPNGAPGKRRAGLRRRAPPEEHRRPSRARLTVGPAGHPAPARRGALASWL